MLVIITLRDEVGEDACYDLADAIHEGLVAGGMPNPARFQKIIKLPKEQFFANPYYPNLSSPRSGNFVLIEILMPVGKSGNEKRDISKNIINAISKRTLVKPRDVMIIIVETNEENWFYYGGEPFVDER